MSAQPQSNGTAKPSWGYCNDNGPDTWAEYFPQANGPRQSPIDICSGPSSEEGIQLAKLDFRYGENCCKAITNTGKGWKVTINADDTKFTGGPLVDAYKLEQFHFHWGVDSTEGSEHTIDGKSYAGELHLVHYNAEKYGSFSEAATKPDGLAVLGIFTKVDSYGTKEFGKILECLSKTPYMSDSEMLTNNIDVKKLLPKNMSYWTYLGSLTTPPCTESVIWILLKTPITITEEQLEVCRSLRSRTESDVACGEPDEFNCCILKNFRTAQPVGERVVSLYDISTDNEIEDE